MASAAVFAPGSNGSAIGKARVQGIRLDKKAAIYIPRRFRDDLF